MCVHAHCTVSIKRHIACILFLPLFGTGACKCKCLEPSRVISIISNCIVSSHVSCPTSPCLNVLACSTFQFVAITILMHFLYLVVLFSSLGTKLRHPISARTRSLLGQTAWRLRTPDLVQLPLASCPGGDSATALTHGFCCKSAKLKECAEPEPSSPH